MFRTVLAVTISADDPSAAAHAYTQTLGYQVEEESVVSSETANVWDTPDMVGRAVITLTPESGADFRLRFVESKPLEGYRPMRTRGWNAVEFLVQSPDDMAERLRDSAFSIIGEPRDLSADGHVRAMQAIGPAGEIIYLTRIRGARVQVYGAAKTMVDRAFIVVVGSDDFGSLVDFYGHRFRHTLQTFGQMKIDVASKALSVSDDTLYDVKLARLGNHFSIELDGYPVTIVERPRHAGALPPGVAMVTIGVQSLDALGAQWRGEPASISGGFYKNARTGVMTGPAGEWLECLEVSSY
ncbi:MAG: hypothetical protein AAF004_05590 [Pseudomonadota bacterium]